MVRQYDRDAVPTIYRLEDVPERQGDGVTQRFFRGLDTMIGVTRVEAGRTGDPHSHPWEQLVYVLDGTCTFQVGTSSKTVEAGDVFLVPPDVEHKAAGGDNPCRLLFCGPLREDALRYTTYQTEFPGGGDGRRRVG